MPSDIFDEIAPAAGDVFDQAAGDVFDRALPEPVKREAAPETTPAPARDPGSDSMLKFIAGRVLNFRQGQSSIGQQASGLLNNAVSQAEKIAETEGAKDKTLAPGMLAELPMVFKPLALKPVRDAIKAGARKLREGFEAESQSLGQGVADLNEGAVGKLASKVVPTVVNSIPIAIAASMTGGLPAAALVAGAQSQGSTFDDSVRAYKGTGLTDDEAESKSLLPAAASGASTALITFAFGKTGIESFARFAKTPAKKVISEVGSKAIVNAAKGALKGFFSEATEEGLDQVVQTVIQKASYNPKLTFDEAVGQVVEAAAIGGLLGGVTHGVESVIEGRVSRRPAPPVIDQPPVIQPASVGGQPLETPIEVTRDETTGNSTAAPSAEATPVAPVPPAAASTPSAQPAPAAQPEAADPLKLPRDLAGAKPRYSYGSKQFTLTFDDDVDMAAYISAQTKPSKRDAAYVKWATGATGLTEAQLRAHGRAIRQSIKGVAATSDSDTLHISRSGEEEATVTPPTPPAPVPPPSPAGKASAETIGAATAPVAPRPAGNISIEVPRPDLSVVDTPITEDDFPNWNAETHAVSHAGINLDTGEPLYWVVKKISALKSANPTPAARISNELDQLQTLEDIGSLTPKQAARLAELRAPAKPAVAPAPQPVSAAPAPAPAAVAPPVAPVVPAAAPVAPAPPVKPPSKTAIGWLNAQGSGNIDQAISAAEGALEVNVRTGNTPEIIKEYRDLIDELKAMKSAPQPAPATPVAKPKKAKQAKAVEPEATTVARTLDNEKGNTFGPAFEQGIGELPTFKDEVKAWWARITGGESFGGRKDKAETRRTIILRNNETGALHEVGIFNNPGPMIVNPDTGKGENAVTFLRTKSKTEGIDNIWTPVATARYAEPAKNFRRVVTPEEVVTLSNQFTSNNSGIAPVADSELKTDTEGNVQGAKGVRVVDKAELDKKKKVTPRPRMQAGEAVELMQFIGNPQWKNRGGGRDVVMNAIFGLKAGKQTREFVKRFMQWVNDNDLATATEAVKLATSIYESIESNKKAVEAGTVPPDQFTSTVLSEVTAEQPAGEAGDSGGDSGAAGAAVSTEPEVDAVDAALTKGIEKLSKRLKGGGRTSAFAAPTWVAEEGARAALVVVRAVYRATRSVARAIASGIESLRDLPGFNQAEAQAWLQSQLADENPGLVTTEGIQDDAENPVSEQPAEQWVKTQVQGKDWFVRGRDQLSPESTEIALRSAEAAITEAGLSPQRRTFTDTDGITKSILFIPKAPNADLRGQALIEILRRELQSRNADGKGADHVAPLVVSIQENFGMADSALADMNPDTRNTLFALATDYTSWTGRALRALRNFRADVIHVGRNVDVMLNRIYSEAFNGPELDKVYTNLGNALRNGMTDAELANVTSGLQGNEAAAVVTAIKQVMAGNIGSVDEALEGARDRLMQAGFTEAQAAAMIKAVEPKLRAKLLEFARAFAEELLQGKDGAGLKVKIGKTKQAKVVADLITSGVFSNSEALKRLAIKSGWRVPTDAEIGKLKALADRATSLLALTPEEEAKITTEKERQEALARVAAAMAEKVAKVQKDIGVMWTMFTKPTGFRHFIELRHNNARFMRELMSSNILLKPSFGTRQLIDVGTQWFMRLPYRAMAEAFDLWHNANPDQRNVQTLFRDLSYSLGSTYKDAIQYMKPAIIRAKAAFAGRIEVRNVDRILSGINALETLWYRADQAEREGKHGEALFLRIMGLGKFAYRYAGALDFVHGTPSEWHHRRFEAVKRLRAEGATHAEAESAADDIMGNMRAEIADAIAMTKSIHDARGSDRSPAELREDAWNLLERNQFMRMQTAGIDADDVFKESAILRNTLGWNNQERRGLGALAGAVVAGVGKGAESIGIPLPMGSFANAISIGINRQLQRTLLYKLADIPTGLKGSEGPSFWSRTKTDIYERRAEAAGWTVLGGILLGLAWHGAIRVFLSPPKDKEEKDLWEAEGHKAFTVEIPLGDGKVSVHSLNTGPLAMAAPYLAAGGALYDLSMARDKQRQKMIADAERLGVAPGELPPISAAEGFNVAMKAAQGMVFGSRTATGMFMSMTDYGKLNVKQFLASQVGPLFPTLPAMQEVSRMAGISLNPDKADFTSFLFPMTSSKGERKVNVLGDPVGTQDDVQRVVQILTGGTYHVVDPAEGRARAAYAALFNSGFRPPPINANKGYVIGNELRLMNDDELNRYTVARGEQFKAALSSMPPNATKAEVAEAFSAANQRALAEVGVAAAPRPSSASSAAVSRQSASSGVPTRNAPSYTGGLSSRRSSSRFGSGRRSSRLGRSRGRSTVKVAASPRGLRKPRGNRLRRR